MYGEDSKSLFYDHQTVTSNNQSFGINISRVHLALNVIESSFQPKIGIESL